MTPRTQIILITLGAIGLYAGIRSLPTGTNLSHTDFRVAGGNSIEFCDPSNPQFIPVVAVRSPVALDVKGETAAVQGQPLRVTARLATSTGKPIAPEDLVVTHTRRLHLLLLDPDLRDYQHVHPEPGQQPGTWTFQFTPNASGAYRVFADFTPAATARGLYASADLEVGPAQAGHLEANAQPASTASPAGDVVFELLPTARPIKAGEMAEFRFRARSASGEAVELEPVMDALAHLVAVDAERSGFAHLHPASIVADGALTFQVTIPKPGRYVIWAQVQIGGRDRYAPFWFDVV